MVKIAAEVQVSTDLKGFQPITMLDWEGKVASTIFLGGCNFRCFFCHNPELVLYAHELPSIAWRDVERHLMARQGWIDGVVVSGGEPCLNPNLKGLLKQIKGLGYPVKLDTNGSFPAVLEDLIGQNLVDYVALDVKTTFDKYHLVTRADPRLIRSSIRLLTSTNTAHEFRTTVVPGLVKREDVSEIARHLGEAGGARYYLQQFKPSKVLAEEAAHIEPYRLRVLEQFVEDADRHIPTKLR